MDGYRKICVLVICIVAVQQVTSTIKEGLNIPEKIIGGVIDIVQSHKNKPLQGQQPTYPPNYQYPQYQQWNGQSNYQSQGFPNQPQYQGQYQNQAQYSYQNGYQLGNYPNNNYPQTPNNNFPQGGNFQQSGGNFATNQVYPSGSGQGFNQAQGQYQGGYQNPNQFTQPNNQFQNTQSGYYTQSGSNTQYPGTSTQFTGQPGFTGQASGQAGQGYYTNGGQQSGQGGQGPTCVCQAWTKPQQDILADTPVTEKIEKKTEPAKET